MIMNLKRYEKIKKIEKSLGAVAGSSPIKSKISKVRRALKGKNPNRDKALSNGNRYDCILQGN
ncbi:MAG: hypothetical protein CM1200mP30_21200 [Pseudomonadota bacterium]|nr:MAG: hypothetical protein CM1200mP30_21200 [Pseudomonadota bacterium]